MWYGIKASTHAGRESSSYVVNLSGVQILQPSCLAYIFVWSFYYRD